MTDLKSPTQASPTRTKHEDSGVSARRLKKREIDRRCQRQARERTKSRIAYLEGLVENLRQSDADERSAALMTRLHKTEKERDGLAHTLKEIQKALGAHEPSIKLEPGSEEVEVSRGSQDEDSRENEILSPEQFNDPIEEAPTIFPPMAYPQPHPTVGLDRLTGVMPESPEVSQEELPKICNDTCECCQEARRDVTGHPRSLWRYANNILVEPYQAHAPITPEEDMLAEDMPIRIVLEGWDAVEAQFGLPVSWRFLKGIDQNLFSQCAPTERLAVLRYMHLLLQYHREPTPERRARLPPWFLARPSQTKPHAYAINYFVWPGLRERFIFQQHKYCSNLFWQLFSNSLEMAWPYDFRDCFAQRWDTGVYQLTPLFTECLSDISRWTMRQDLFMKFPDLRCDIPASAVGCGLRPVGNSLQLGMAQMKGNAMMGGSGMMVKKRADEEVKQQQSILMEGWSPAPVMAPWMTNPMMVGGTHMGATWIS
jgi:hypothetical protein